MTGTETDIHTRALSGFVRDKGAYRIAVALLTASRPMSVAELAQIGGVARTAVSRVGWVLRGHGFDVRVTRTDDTGESLYHIQDLSEVAA